MEYIQIDVIIIIIIIVILFISYYHRWIGYQLKPGFVIHVYLSHLHSNRNSKLCEAFNRCFLPFISLLNHTCHSLYIYYERVFIFGESRLAFFLR